MFQDPPDRLVELDHLKRGGDAVRGAGGTKVLYGGILGAMHHHDRNSRSATDFLDRLQAPAAVAFREVDHDYVRSPRDNQFEEIALALSGGNPALPMTDFVARERKILVCDNMAGEMSTGLLSTPYR